jgi:uncharacterized membrane protein YvbJ
MRCAKCGSDNREGAKFCSRHACGFARIGSAGSCRRRYCAGTFQTEELPQTALIKRIRAKTRRGYVLKVLLYSVS